MDVVNEHNVDESKANSISDQSKKKSDIIDDISDVKNDVFDNVEGKIFAQVAACILHFQKKRKNFTKV